MFRSRLLRFLTLLLVWVTLSNWAKAQQQRITEAQFDAMRERLVTHILVPGGIKDPRVLRSAGETRRHEFVPKEYQEQAYNDIAIPIGQSQTISSPFIVSLMTEYLDTKPTDKVLEIGTGSGYQAAILSPLVQDVYTIEIVEPLGLKTTKLLADLGYTNVHCKIGDGFKGWPDFAPFDKIIVTCSPEDVPQPLVDQLKEGGIMIIPVGERYQQMLCKMKKVEGKLIKEDLRPTLFVPMTGTAEANRKVAPDPLNPKLLNGSFEEALIKDIHIPGWYYQFGCVVKENDKAPDQSHFVEFRSNNGKEPSMLLQGIPMDGTVVKQIRISGWIATQDVKLGDDKEKSPSIAIQFFDAKRQRIGYNYVGGFKGTRPWKREEKTFKVPPATREAIVSIGLFGAEGTAQFDDITIEKR